jgi:hypothetical protein
MIMADGGGTTTTATDARQAASDAGKRATKPRPPASTVPTAGMALPACLRPAPGKPVHRGLGKAAVNRPCRSFGE